MSTSCISSASSGELTPLTRNTYSSPKASKKPRGGNSTGNGYNNNNQHRDYQHRIVEQTTDNANISENDEALINDRVGNGDNSVNKDNGRKKLKDTCVVSATIIASVLAILLCLVWLLVYSFGEHEYDSPSDNSKNNDNSDYHESGKNGNIHGLSTSKIRQAQHLFDDQNRFVIEDYDAKPTFSDFLPGVAGIYGKPVWAFYVNRGQGIASFGTKSKEYPIMKFSSANQAYQQTSLLGFRTFIKGSRGNNNNDESSFLIEPFTPQKTRHHSTYNGNDVNADESLLPKRYMYVGANEMQIQEIDSLHDIETNVTYITLPEEDFGSFVRKTVITNTAAVGNANEGKRRGGGHRQTLSLSILDGLAQIQPAGGMLRKPLEEISRTLEGWKGVYSPYNDTLTMPYFRLSTRIDDIAAVQVQEAGHYCLSVIEWQPLRPYFSDNDNMNYNQEQLPYLLPIIYDTSKIFGEDTTLLRPIMLERGKSIRDIIDGRQYGTSKTSSAFAAVDDISLKPGESIHITTYFGKTDHVLEVPVIARRVIQPGYSMYKFERARELINQITASVETKTGNHLFNGHVQQMFLDNSLRGGIPMILGEENSDAASIDDVKLHSADEDSRLKVYHVFGRIHGDLERDYNDFQIAPTFFSQGPGNFRDIAQNRRNDVVFNPRIGAYNLKTFLSFIQADGYEPLSVEAPVFTIGNDNICDELAGKAVGRADGHRAQREALARILKNGPFRPGQLFLLMEEQNIPLIIGRQEFIDSIAAAAAYTPYAVYKTGFWADHWTYYCEMIETFLSIFPDKEESFMYNENLPYFFSPSSVKPRSKKYVVSNAFHGNGKHIRQLDATVQEDKRKLRAKMEYFDNVTGWFSPDANWQRDESSHVFKSSPIAKLFLLGALKFGTRDAYGMGIEYEGGRPGWNDAMNGLPGMLGSGMPETFELEVLLKYILNLTERHKRSIVVPSELAVFIESMNSALFNLTYQDDNELKTVVPNELFTYWDKVSSAREKYRKSVYSHFTGSTVELKPSNIIVFLPKWIKEIERGKERALKLGSRGYGDNGTTGITPTYFSYNITEWKLTGKHDKESRPFANALKMEVGHFPLFLEGPVRMMKTLESDSAKEVYNNVRKSALRDEEIGMYTISASLKGQSYDMGRMMAFTPGWLENQSVWTHIHYKFLLQLLKHDLVDDFYDEMTKGAMLPFNDPDRYGRSLMQCSSFIASSAFEDPSSHGRGFLPRLSGSTAEFLSMWVLMMIGPKPFFLDEQTGALQMQLKPALPLWLFESDGIVTERDAKAMAKQPLTISFRLFASITVTYHNNRREDLFGVPPNRYEIGLRDGSKSFVDGTSIPTELSNKIRRVVFVDSIDAYFD